MNAKKNSPGKGGRPPPPTDPRTLVVLQQGWISDSMGSAPERMRKPCWVRLQFEMDSDGAADLKSIRIQESRPTGTT